MIDGRRNMLSQDEIVAENDMFFAPIGPTIIDLARQYNLVLEKYYHDAPCWSLCFSHPQAGSAKVDICQESDSTVSIVGVWWVDDYDCGTRSLKWTTKAEVGRESGFVKKGVIAALKTLLGSKLGEWTQIATGYHGIWSKTWTKAQFEQLQSAQFPVPNFESLR